MARATATRCSGSARPRGALVAMLMVVMFGLPATAAARTDPVLTPASTPQAIARTVRQMTGEPESALTVTRPCGAPVAGHPACALELLAERQSGVPAPASADERSGEASPALRARTSGVRAADLSGQPAPEAGTPASLQQAYDLTWLSANGGAGDTIGIVDVGRDPDAASDLTAYRSAYGLPACTTTSGCLSIVNQAGKSNPLPASNLSNSWQEETELDLEAVSALCPNCHILLVEATADTTADLAAGDAAAATLGVNQISNSFGVGATTDPATWTFPGVATIAATGDVGVNDGEQSSSGPWSYPAADPAVTAVGGTSLTAAPGPRGFGESTWDDSYGAPGSGCDTEEAKPAWQTDPACPGRAYADVSADADVDTGLVGYDAPQGGWVIFGGTSLAAPLTAAFEAVSAVSGTTPEWAYTDQALLNDPISGTNGTCLIQYICTATTGYDGPTGEGTVSGALSTGAPGIGGPDVNDGAGYAAAVNATSATLTGGVYPNGRASSYYWQYGTSTSYGSQSAPVNVGSGSAIVPVTSTLTGLAPSTTYHYRLVAVNAEGTDDGYDFTLTTPATNAAPAVSADPTITGTFTEGQTLTAGPGTWSPSGTVAYQWMRDTGSGPEAIAGATGATYTLAAADVGASVSVAVTETDAAGAGSASSAESQTISTATPQNEGAPTVTGTAEQGQTLTATQGTWNAWDLPMYSFQWESSADGGQSWVHISGANTATYTPGNADVGNALRVLVTATDTWGQSTPAASNPTAAVTSGIPEPVGGEGPSISGTAARAQTLTLATGSWSPVADSFGEQWQSSTDGGSTWTDIPGATGLGYTPAQSDEGALLRVQVTGVSPYGSTTTTTPSVGPVAASLPVNGGLPGMTGSPTAGGSLSVSAGLWQFGGAVSYQWQLDTGPGWQNISGATTNAYEDSVSDGGDQIRVQVTNTNVDGAVTVNTPPLTLQATPATALPPTTTPASPSAPVIRAAPVISGGPRVGQTLTVSATGIENATGHTVTWQHCAATCVTQSSGAKLTLTRADAGSYLRVTVTATGAGGTARARSRLIGPILGPGAAAHPVGGGAHLTLADSTHARLATARTGPYARGRMTITVQRSAPAHDGPVRVWVCSGSRAGAPMCSRPRRLASGTTTITTASHHVELIVVAAR